MEVDQENNSQLDLKNYELPNFGTKIYLKTYKPTIDCAKTVKELFEEYKKYCLLHKKDSMMSGVEAGTVAYIVSTNWLNNYYKFILYD